MHVQTGCSGNDSAVVIPSLPLSDSKPVESPRFLMDGLGTKHRVWFQWFGTNFGRRPTITVVQLICW